MDQLTSLKVFGHVVECGGFSAAARRMNISVTMVSKHIHALEERLGVRLLNRTTRKLNVTEIGRMYYERSSQIVTDLDDANHIADALHATPRGVLRLYVNTHLIRILALILAEYLTLYPAVKVDLTIGDEKPDLIEEGYDLAVRTVPPSASGLIIRRLTPWRQVVCCSPSYFESHPVPRQPADLVHHNCLQYTFFPSGNEWRFEGPDDRPVSVRVAGNLVTSSAELLRSLGLAGIGVLIVPSFLIQHDLASGALLPLLPDYRLIEFSITAIYPHRRLLSSKVRSLIDMLATRLPGSSQHPAHSASASMITSADASIVERRRRPAG